jgi:hypothetical protein
LKDQQNSWKLISHIWFGLTVLKINKYVEKLFFVGVRVMVFNATFSNISVILWRSVLLVEETGVPRRKPLNYRMSPTSYFLCWVLFFRCKSPNAVFFLRSDDIVKSLPEQSVKRFVDKEPLNQQHILVSTNTVI